MSEKYLELYKKYRPRKWEDMIGQETTVKSLQKMVVEDKVPTAFLFSGGHGSGKTSSALILAKALNCENPPGDGNPCNECATCKNIDKNSQPGVVYLSMANHGSADSIREITKDASFLFPLKYPVFILDEVHTLSSTAQDALLIPLESEQMNSRFILCSTDPEKIKPTIMSRVQTRVFNPVEDRVIAKHLKAIAELENIEVTKEQIIQAAKSAKGSVRDSLRNLETLKTTGTLTEEVSSKVLKAVHSGNCVNIFKVTNEMAAKGNNFTKTAESIYRELSFALIAAAGGTTSEEHKDIATKFGGGFIIKALDVLGAAIIKMSSPALDSRVLLEIALVELTRLWGNKQKQGAK